MSIPYTRFYFNQLVTREILLPLLFSSLLPPKFYCFSLHSQCYPYTQQLVWNSSLRLYSYLLEPPLQNILVAVIIGNIFQTNLFEYNKLKGCVKTNFWGSLLRMKSKKLYYNFKTWFKSCSETWKDMRNSIPVFVSGINRNIFFTSISLCNKIHLPQKSFVHGIRWT